MNKKSQYSKPTTDFWNDTILQNIDYARYLAKHKYNLGSAGVKMGLSPGKILAHDWSKFKPKSFDVYEDFLYGPTGHRGTNSPETFKAFKQEFTKHYGTEVHHNHKLGLPEDVQTQIESVADWYSVAKSNADIKGLAFPDFIDWWDARKNSFLMKGTISRDVYEQVEKTLAKNYNILTYTADKIKELFR
jgi:hypothetical protein